MLEARRREALIRNRYLVGSMTILVVLISVIGIGVQANRARITGSLTATNATVKNGVVVGKAAPVTIDVFEDFQCPYCQQFQSAAGSDIDKLISSGKAQVRFHMVAFLDSSSDGNKYSTRAANAGICASDISTAQFLKYHDYLYGKDKSGASIQPAEGTDGRTDSDLENYAKAVGITGTALTTFQSCVATQEHLALVEAITNNWSERGFTGTPVVIVNGKQLKDNTKAELDAAVAAGSKK
jgi:protein-disulfide isomerase